MSPKIYNFLQIMSRIVLPISGITVYILHEVISFPEEHLFLGFVLVIAAVIGITLHIVARRYDPKTLFQGELIVTENDGKKLFSLELNRSPDEIVQMESITFKVVDVVKQALAE